MKPMLFRFLLCGLMLCFAAVGALAQTQPGTIKAARIEGTVSKVAADGSLQPITNGTILTENDTVVTGDGAGVVLVFMNGSSVKLGAASRIAIEEFKMDPLAEDIAVAQLSKEPSVSKTTLNLVYGEMVGDVKKLNKSSSYSVKTPAGAAGIRGTIFRIVFTRSPDGLTFNFSLSTAEGLVQLYTGSVDSAPVDVPANQEVVVQADVNTTTGVVSNIQVQTQGISPEASQVISAAVATVIQQAQTESVFTQVEQQATSNTNTTTNQNSNNQNNNNSTSTENKTDTTNPIQKQPFVVPVSPT